MAYFGLSFIVKLSWQQTATIKFEVNISKRIFSLRNATKIETKCANIFISIFAIYFICAYICVWVCWGFYHFSGSVKCLLWHLFHNSCVACLAYRIKYMYVPVYIPVGYVECFTLNMRLPLLILSGGVQSSWKSVHRIFWICTVGGPRFIAAHFLDLTLRGKNVREYTCKRNQRKDMHQSI